MKVIVFLILGMFLSTYVVFSVSAGYITIKTATTVAVDDSNLKVKVVVTNEGDESAFNVQTNINENQRIQFSPIKQALAVKENFEYEAKYSLTQTKNGRYPLIINVDYTDANQYPFSALTGTYYSFGSDGMCQWKLDTLLMSLVYFPKGYFLFRMINPGSHRQAWRFR